MRTSQAAISGAMIGVLAAVVICTVQNIAWLDTIERAFVLGGTGAWMGMLLAWLNQMLIPKKPDNIPEDDTENRA